MLHLLAQGGWIEVVRDEDEAPVLECYSRDGWLFIGLTELLFRKLKRKRAIASKNGGPYRVTRRGLQLVRSQLNNR